MVWSWSPWATAATRRCARSGRSHSRAMPICRFLGDISYALDEWLREEATIVDGSFVAVNAESRSATPVCSHMRRSGVRDHGLTVVRRDRRRRGIATMLKRAHAQLGGASGLSELITWTQRGNEAMQALNRRLGYADDIEVNPFQAHSRLPGDRKTAPIPGREERASMGMIESKDRATSDPRRARTSLEQIGEGGHRIPPLLVHRHRGASEELRDHAVGELEARSTTAWASTARRSPASTRSRSRTWSRSPTRRRSA